jgi:hypothetical protein
VAELLRIVTLSLITFVAFAGSWQLAALAGAGARSSTSSDLALRVEPAGRGLVAAARIASAFDIPDTRATTSGVALILAAGVPFTIVEGGVSRPSRAPRGSTLAAAVELAGVSLGPLDQVVASKEGGTVGPGDVLRVLRVTESEAVVREEIPFGVRTVADPSLPLGRTVVVSAGVPGVAENTYRVRAVDGAEAERMLLVTVEIVAPVAEVRRVGTQAPPAPATIQAIIRDAAAAWGADPDQLLRVAYCESRYNPNAYNPTSGASGLFQFLPRTWSANSVRAGYGGASPFDAVANANTAAMMFAAGQAGQWSCK